MKMRILAGLWLLSLSLPSNLSAQEKTKIDQHAIVVTADQPNVWTLEQAHYLLAQMHRRNLDLKATGLGDLDPNEINGVNIDVLKQLLQVSAEFDQAKGFNNNILKDQKTFNASRRMTLLNRRAALQDELMTLTRKRGELLVQASQTKDDVERARLEAMANEVTVVQTAIRDQVKEIDAELATLAPATGDFQSTDPEPLTFSKDSLAGANDSTFEAAVKKAVESFSSSPKLNASLRLDNYLQMQYEILSKQLTLLRDEVGPGERLIFLEMPQSIRSTYDKAGNKWAQSWWKIRAYTHCKGAPKPDFFQFSSLAGSLQQGSAIAKNMSRHLTDITGLTDPEDYKKVLDRLQSSGKRMAGAAELIDSASDAFTPGQDQTDPYAEKRTAIRQLAYATLEDALKDLTSSLDAFESSGLWSDLTRIEAASKPVAVPVSGKATPTPSPVAAADRTESSVRELRALHAEFERLRIRRQMDPAYLAWMRLHEKYAFLNSLSSPDRRKKLARLPEVIADDLRTLGYTDQTVIGKKSVELSLDMAAASTDSDSDGSLDSEQEDEPCGAVSGRYQSTSSTIAGLIKGLSDEKYEVVDLDTDLSENKTGLAVNSPLYELFTRIQADFQTDTTKESNTKSYFPVLDNREVRIVDMFPRQSSLNVNEVKQRTYNMSLRFIFNIISGFGGNGDYMRTRERYSQFVQQELYSAGFGKGAREFGWTFYPMPGTDRVSSGTRTTYAIMVVPKQANTLVLQSTGCYYARNERQFETFKQALQFDNEGRINNSGRCSAPRSFIVPIPTAVSGGNVFWVDRMDYKPVPAGKRVTVSIRGRDFSTQIGILVDGVSLRPSLGLGQPLILDDSAAGKLVTDSGPIKGSFERVSSSQIIASFEMGPDYKNKTPQITLIAPGKALLLNSLRRLRIGNTPATTLDAADNMFGDGRGGTTSTVSITTANIFKDAAGLKAVIHGTELDRVDAVFANGTQCQYTPPKHKPLIVCTFPTTDVATISLTLRAGDISIQHTALPNPDAAKTPATAAGGGAAEVKFEESDDFATEDAVVYTSRRKPNTVEDYIVTYSLKGKGFTKDTTADKGEFVYRTATTARLIIDYSEYSEKITLKKGKEKPPLKTIVFLPVPAELRPKAKKEPKP